MVILSTSINSLPQCFTPLKAQKEGREGGKSVCGGGAQDSIGGARDEKSVVALFTYEATKSKKILLLDILLLYV